MYINIYILFIYIYIYIHVHIPIPQHEINEKGRTSPRPLPIVWNK